MAEWMAAYLPDAWGFGAPADLDAGIDYGALPDFATVDIGSTISGGVFGENPPDGATGYNGGFEQLLGQINAASDTLFGVAGRGFTLADQLASKSASGGYYPAAGPAVAADGGGLSLPVVGVMALGIVGALYLAFR